MFLWLVVGLILLWAWVSTRRPSWSPKGPPLLPWVGHLFSFDVKHPHRSLSQWAKQYGDIYYCKFGVQESVILSDPDLIREAFSKPEISARPNSELFMFAVEGKGIASSSGQLWHESRRFTLHSLRDLGMGKSKLEHSIHTQVTNFMDEVLAPNCGKAIKLDSSLNIAIVNIIWKMVASEELSLSDPKGMLVNDMINESIQYSQTLAILDALPWLNYVLPGSVFKRNETEKRIQRLLSENLMPAVEQHREQLDIHSEPRDYLDAVLQEQMKKPNLYTDWHIVVIIGDLFFAGNDTTATTLNWIFCLLCENPSVQCRVQDEIDAIVGHNRLPSLADRIKMPYTDAVIHESQRLGDIVPMGLPHATTAPTTIGGYNIPAGIQVVSNLRSVHYSETLFPEPEQFRPERFIDANGKFRPDKNVMPFSTGRRQCLGEGMARSELFLFVTSFLQSYSFCWPEGFRHGLKEEKEMNLLRKPAAYELIPQKR